MPLFCNSWSVEMANSYLGLKNPKGGTLVIFEKTEASESIDLIWYLVSPGNTCSPAPNVRFKFQKRETNTRQIIISTNPCIPSWMREKFNLKQYESSPLGRVT